VAAIWFVPDRKIEKPDHQYPTEAKMAILKNCHKIRGIFFYSIKIATVRIYNQCLAFSQCYLYPERYLKTPPTGNNDIGHSAF